MSTKPTHSHAGFTLIELMVATAAFALVSLAAFSVLSTGQRTAVANDQIVKIQQSARLALDLMSRDIRMSGYGSPPGIPLPAGCGGPLTATDGGTGPGAPDTIGIVSVGQVLGYLAAPFTAGNVIAVNGPDGQPLAPGAVAGGNVITIEGIWTASINTIAGNQLTLSRSIQAPRNFFGSAGSGASVVQLVCVNYSVTGAGGNPPYQLMRTVGVPIPANAVPIVDGIETIQVAYALDANNDGLIDNPSGVGNAVTVDCLVFVPNDGPCGGFPAGTGTASNLALLPSINANPTSVRLVRLTVVGRAIPPAVQNVPGNCWRDRAISGLVAATGTSAMQVENQLLPEAAPPGLLCAPVPAGTSGGIRRRALTRVVNLRDTIN